MKSLVWSLLCLSMTATRPAVAQAPAKPADPNEPRAASGRADDVQDLIVWTDARPLLVRLHITIDGKPFRQVGRNYLNRLFDELDRDSDGSLSKDEAVRAPSLSGSAFGFRQPVRPQDSLLAKAGDADGKVNRDAFLAFYETSDAAPFTTGTGPGRSKLGVAAMELLDTNRDRQLSADELRAAESLLLKRDFDDDEVVTDAELVPGQNQFGQGAFVVDGAITGGAPNTLVTPVEPNAGRAMADAILRRYDTNRDGKLSAGDGVATELRLPARTAAELDADGDGMLDRDELVRFVDRQPDIEQRLALAAATPTGPRETPEPAKYDQPAEFSQKTLSDGATLVDAGDTQLEFRQGPTAAGPAIRQTAQAQFRAFDPDNNGYIDEAESRRIPFIATSFPALDRDGDGKVFKEEFEAFLERQVAAASTRVTLTVTDEGRQLFELLDKNRDGRLMLREMRAGSDLLSEADADFDGVLGGVEIPRRLRLDLTRGSTFGQFGRSVVVSAGMRPQVTRGAAPSAGPVWFRKMDHNRDGDLSPREFLGPAGDFTRLDADHDGLITAREADAAGTGR